MIDGNERKEALWNGTWITLFIAWTVLLTGITHPWLGSPGIIQALRLNSLLNSRQQQLSSIEKQLAHLSAQSERLETSTIAQEQEIRRTLGYLSPDEMVFDFSGGLSGDFAPSSAEIASRELKR